MPPWGTSTWTASSWASVAPMRSVLGEARRGADEQRAPVVAAQHAGERALVSGGDLLHDALALAGPHDRLHGVGHPDGAFGVGADAVGGDGDLPEHLLGRRGSWAARPNYHPVAPSTACRRGRCAKALSRCPNDSATTSVLPSTTDRSGTRAHRPPRWPSRRGPPGRARLALLRRRHVESEVAHVGAPGGVDHHVVAFARAPSRLGRRARRAGHPRAQIRGRASRRRASDRRATSRVLTAVRPPRRQVSALPLPSMREHAVRVESDKYYRRPSRQRGHSRRTCTRRRRRCTSRLMPGLLSHRRVHP